METSCGVKLDSHNLRDLLRMKEEDHHNNLNHCSASSGGVGRSNSSGLTLLSLLTEKIGQPSTPDEPLQSGAQSSRTLLDIIREDRMSGYGGGRSDGGRSWRQLRDKIRLRQRGRGRGSNWSSTAPIQAADVHRVVIASRRHSDRFSSSVPSGEPTESSISAAPDVTARSPAAHRNSTPETERPSGGVEQTSSLPQSQSVIEDNPRSDEQLAERLTGNVESAEGVADSEGSSEQPARTSLMSLLAQNDRQMGLKGSAFVMCEDLKEAEGSGGDAAEYNNCCVCMVRHKGAAFIPCGHTFCRLCSRELWVQRGNCPICNNYILEILDIF